MALDGKVVSQVRTVIEILDTARVNYGSEWSTKDRDLCEQALTLLKLLLPEDDDDE